MEGNRLEMKRGPSSDGLTARLGFPRPLHSAHPPGAGPRKGPDPANVLSAENPELFRGWKFRRTGRFACPANVLVVSNKRYRFS